MRGRDGAGEGGRRSPPGPALHPQSPSLPPASASTQPWKGRKMGKVVVPHDPALDAPKVAEILRARMGDHCDVSLRSEKAVKVKTSDWCGVFLTVRHKPDKDQTVIRSGRGIPEVK